MKNKFKKGIITLQTILMVSTSVATVTGAFFTSKFVTYQTINDSEKSLTVDINENKNEITKNTTNIENMVKNTSDIKKQNEEIIKLLMNKL